MKSFSSKTFVIVSIVSVVLLSSLALAAPSKVAGGKHDFSASGASFQYHATAGTLGDQVCVYCHTPHNAGQNRLLWNKASGGNNTFKMYTSSDSLSTAVKTTVLSANSPSLICLSCHDGKTAMNVLHTGGSGALATAASPAVVGTYPAGSMLSFGTAPFVMQNMTWMFGGADTGPAIGGSISGDDLSNDHPIGFSYQAVLDESPQQAAGLWNTAQVATNSTNRVRFFGAGKMVECSTCHDPHVDNTDGTQNPFLVMPNSGSALCLACHNK